MGVTRMRSGYRAGLLIGLMTLIGACKPGLTTTQAQAPAVPRNEVAERFLAQGEAALQVRNYGDAAIAFDNAALQPFNQVTTAALYLSGLAYSYQAEYDRALEKFQQLISQYPESRFVEEANYEKAGILLRRPGSE
ncbi:MAG: tetratricopeptide repeat protein, partial [Bacteroidia bacterium]|nr:tetratricopeptide repeat protein [Bacteroidia bacterium]